MTEYSKVQNKTRKDQRSLHLQTTSHTDRWRQTAADSSWKQPPYGPGRQEGISFLFFPSSASFLPSFQEGYMFGHAGSQTAPCWATDSSLTTTGATGSTGALCLHTAQAQCNSRSNRGAAELSLWVMLYPQLCKGTKPLSIETIKYIKEWIISKKTSERCCGNFLRAPQTH